MSAEAVLDAALDRVCDPCSLAAGTPLSLPAMGLIRHRSVDADGRVRVTVGVTGPGCTLMGLLVSAVEREVRVGFGPEVDVTVDLDVTTVWSEADLAPAARAALAGHRRRTVTALGLRPRMWEEEGAA